MHTMAGKEIDIGQWKQEVKAFQFTTDLLAHFTQKTIGDAFARIHKPSRQIQRTTGRFTVATHTEQFATGIRDDCHCRCGSIGIECETTIGTTLTEYIIFVKTR